MKIKKYLLLLVIPLLFTSCFEDMDDNIRPASTVDIQDFIYRGLNFFYLYKEDTPELADNVFESQEAKTNFLKGFDSPESLFDYLISPQDRFSRLFDNYIAIENALSGVSLSNGMEFGLVYYPDNSRNVFGYVRYVLPNTDADIHGLKRGDLFTTVNGTQLNESNYSSLLSEDNYTIGLAIYDGSGFTPTGDEVSLTKIEYDENPVHISRTLDINGHKIGYLMYTSFITRYDVELNNAFAQFRADGITDLVVDLRYNGGGSVATATDLASMITGQFNGEVFYQEFWNADRQPQYASNGLFDSKISNGASINSLNLNNVYFLTTQSTASASELVINGLSPYINTIQIGDNTTGKFQASFLMYDSPDFSRSGVNLGHTYAMLPLVFKTANKVGHTDYNDGLFPDIPINENFFDLGELGDPNELFLAAALSQITGAPFTAPDQFLTMEELPVSQKAKPLQGVMVVDMEE